MAVHHGALEVITGCMFSGKTEELLRRQRWAEIAGLATQLFKPSLDSRHGKDTVGTHSGQAVASALSVDHPRALLAQVTDGIQGVFIDEVQFFSAEIVDVCAYLAHWGKRVVVCGLNQDFRGEPFDNMAQLLARADTVVQLQGICNRCGAPSTRSQRLIDGQPAHVNDPTVLVGGSESYEARCRDCHEVGGQRSAPPLYDQATSSVQALGPA